MSARSTSTPAGGAVVGQLSALPAWQADLIMAARLWMENPDTRAQVCDGFLDNLGPKAGHTHIQQFDAVISTLCAHGRRPFVRHSPGCTCLGADEAVLALLAQEAARGDLAEAAMIAALLTPARYAEPLALMAAEVGQVMQALCRMPHRLRHRPATHADHTAHRLH